MIEPEYPDGLYQKFTFNFELDPVTRNYSLYCPEWKCEIPCGDNPQQRAIELLNEIINHNKEELNIK